MPTTSAFETPDEDLVGGVKKEQLGTQLLGPQLMVDGGGARTTAWFGLSYAGQVQFGLITDAALTPDPEAVVSRFPEEFEQYLHYVLLDPPPLD